MKEPDLSLTKKDFTVRWFSGTGPGGQHRNKSQNCIEIIHKESGIKAQCTSHKSRLTNQREAFRLLATRLQPWIKQKLGLGSEGSNGRQTEIIRNYHGVRNEVKDHASDLRLRYTDVVDGCNIGPMIDARRDSMAGAE